MSPRSLHLRVLPAARRACVARAARPPASLAGEPGTTLHREPRRPAPPPPGSPAEADTTQRRDEPRRPPDAAGSSATPADDARRASACAAGRSRALRRARARATAPGARARAEGEAAVGAREPGEPSPAARRAPRARRPRPRRSRRRCRPRSRLDLGRARFFIESFQIPPFLLPIFQAAGTAYGIPWQVLAAINEVETDYGRDLSVSSAGAEGWMQFLPAEWAQYGVDANGDGWKDPYNPADAIFAAARYLHAAGGDTNIKAAVYSYNHSQAYVESVMLRAQLLGGTPPELLGAITGLTEARFPVYAPRTTATASRPLARRASTETARRHHDLLPSRRAGDRRRRMAKSCRSGNRPRSGATSRCVTRTATPTSTRELGELASVYPVLEPRVDSTVSPRIAKPTGSAEPAPSGPATAGAQPRSPLSEGATISGLALGAAAAPRTPAELARATVTRAARAVLAAGEAALLHGRLERGLSASARRRRAGDRGHRARPRRRPRRRHASRRSAAHPLPDPPRRRGRAADRPQADPRRLGGARRHLDLQGQG